MAANIWWITWLGCALSLRFNRSNKWSIGFKSRLFEGHLGVCTLFATHITTLVIFKSHDMMCNPMPTSYRDWQGYEEEEPNEWRHFDTSLQLWIIEWFNLEFSCAGKRLCAFCYAYFCFIYCFSYYTINEEYFPANIDNHYAVHEESNHITYLRAYRMDSFVHGNISFFLLIDRLVCTIQSNQTLEALITYVA